MKKRTKEPLAKSSTGMVHGIRPDGKTGCGRSIRGWDLGYLWTSEDEGVSHRCWACVNSGFLKERVPNVVLICLDCSLELSDPWVAQRHRHYLPGERA